MVAMAMATRTWGLGLVLALLGTACTAGEDPAVGDQASNVFAFPAEGTCEFVGMLEVANEVTFEGLDDDVELDRRAAENIVAARPFSSLKELDDVSYVGESALKKILAYAKTSGAVASCEGLDGDEVGIISDLDKTVIPAANPDLSEKPFPGVATLYQILENQNGGIAGDMYYVTARQPEGVVDVPAYLEAHRVPAGPIATGVSGVPWVAEPEKVRDCEEILAATGDQRFVLLGDSSHRDPEVYKTILALHPDRVIAGFIHKVNNTVSASRVEGLYLHESYAEVAAVLYGLGTLSRQEARSVMEAAMDEGLAIDEETIEALLDANAPDA